MKKLIPLTSLLMLSGSVLFAQVTPQKKLKDIQANTVLAPSPIKIDGNLKEWNDDFQAYNKSTHLFYTIANDENNIYLVVKTSDMTTSAKIAAGGITLALNTAGKKKETEAYSLTYPIIPRNAGRPGGMMGGGGPGGGGGAPRTMVFSMGPDGNARGTAPDSAMLKAAHERTINAAKEIKVFGFKDITDSLIAIYNEYNIKAAIGYDKDGSFTYELAVPLKLIALSADKPKEIAYNIKLNGLQLNFRMPDGGGPGRGGDGGGPGGGGGFGGGPGGGGGRVMNFGGGGGKNSIDFQDLISPSDFWGKYTLAKK